MIFGGLGASGADLAKKLGNVPKNCAMSVPIAVHLGGHFRQWSPNSQHQKICCFSDPAFSAQNRPRAPQSEHHSRSGCQKVAKMEPKMMTFRGPAEKLKSEPGSSESPVEAVPGAPRITQNSMLFLKALPEAHFWGPGGPKRRPRQILGQIGPILGFHLGALWS